MTIESSVSGLTTSTTALIAAVAVQQSTVTTAVGAFTAITSRVSAGLNLVDNTADANKPVSAAQQSALDTKQATLVSGSNISTVNGLSLLSGAPLVIQRSATSLNNVSYDNRAFLRTLSPQVDDSTVIPSLGLFMWVASKDEPDDDETCFTTGAGQWLLQAPAFDLLEAWAMIENSALNDFMEDEPARFAAFTKTR